MVSSTCLENQIETMFEKLVLNLSQTFLTYSTFNIVFIDFSKQVKLIVILPYLRFVEFIYVYPCP